jgi:outer membrane lipoprotein-sorting protein
MRHIAKGILAALCVAGFAASAAAFEKLTSRITTGTMAVSTAGGEFPASIEVYNQAPNKIRTLITLDLSAAGAGSLVIDQRFDGTDGFISDPMRGDGPMSSSQVQSLRNNTFPTPFLDYKKRGTKVDLAGKEKVGDREAFVLAVTPAEGPGSRIFVDAQTYLPLRAISTVEMPEIGNVEQTVDFSDFREVEGIQTPFTLKGSSSVQTFTVRVSKIENNPKIDPALFVKPVK